MAKDLGPPPIERVGGELRFTLDTLEERHWWALQKFRDIGAARVYVSFKCVSRWQVPRLRSEPPQFG